MNSEEIINTGKKVLRDEINSINKVIDNIDISFFKSVCLLSEAKKIILTGIGKSGLIAQKIAATFSSLGFPSVFLHPVEALHGDIGIVQAGDVAILLSKSGSTEEIVKLLPYLKSRQCKTIALAGEANSYLAINSDNFINAEVESEACYLNLAPTNSTTVALAIGDALSVALSKYQDLKVEDFAKQHPLGQLGRNVTLQVKDVMHKGDKMPFIYNGDEFIKAIIEISAKKLGCVCIIDKDKKLCGLITDGDIRRTLMNNYDIRDLTVNDIMTKNPITINPEILLGEAISVMSNRESQISVLPVVDNNYHCIGVIRVHDIIRSGL
jgi:arabinose-5-phosphate isomerase